MRSKRERKHAAHSLTPRPELAARYMHPTPPTHDLARRCTTAAPGRRDSHAPQGNGLHGRRVVVQSDALYKHMEAAGLMKVKPGASIGVRLDVLCAGNAGRRPPGHAYSDRQRPGPRRCRPTPRSLQPAPAKQKP